jgi:hypothetical protein
MQTQQLFPSTPQALAQFGTAVGIDGDTIAIGAPGQDGTTATAEGAVFVFRFDPATSLWSETRRLDSATPVEQGGYGSSVAVDGDAVAAGATGELEPVSGFYSGAVHVRRRDASGVYQLEGTVHRSNPTVGDLFGYLVALEGNALVVAAPFSDADSSTAFEGAVDVFDGSGGTWNHAQELLGSDHQDDGPFGQFFGFGMGLDGPLAAGTRLAVGAPFDDGIGAVDVFRHDGSSFVAEIRLLPPPGDQDDGGNFGMAVALRGNHLVAGKPHDDPLLFSYVGSAHTFRYHPRSGWVGDVKLAPTSPTTDQFGSALAIGDDHVLIGAHGRDVNGNTDAGEVFTYPADEIVVDLDPDAPPPGSVVTDVALFGEPDRPLVIAIVDVGGVPVFAIVDIDVYGADGRFHFDATTPTPLYGVLFGFQGFEISPTGRIVASDVEYILL